MANFLLMEFHGYIHGNSKAWTRSTALTSYIYIANTWYRCVEHRFELADGPALRADGPALRPDSPRSGQSAPVGRTVRTCAEQFRVPSFVLCLLARFAELARNPVV
jgi:hypothetical protein